MSMERGTNEEKSSGRYLPVVVIEVVVDVVVVVAAISK